MRYPEEATEPGKIPRFSALIEEKWNNRFKGLGRTVLFLFAQVFDLSAVTFCQVGEQLHGGPFIGVAFVFQ